MSEEEPQEEFSEDEPHLVEEKKERPSYDSVRINLVN